MATSCGAGGLHDGWHPKTRKTIWVFPKIGGKAPKWMVKMMENPIKMDDLGGPPIFLETPISGS